MKVLLTGGAGYIGSHTYLSMREAGHDPIILDNFRNSSADVIRKLGALSGDDPEFHECDIRDATGLQVILDKTKPDAIVHFAGLKAVAESMTDPLSYMSNNVAGTQTLLSALQDAGIFKFIFSSSATVYGTPTELPITETHPLSYVNHYGMTKLMVEQMLTALHESDPRWSIVNLRYFNPIGAHPPVKSVRCQAAFRTT